MPASAAVIANLTTRPDLNYPTAEEVQVRLLFDPFESPYTVFFIKPACCTVGAG